MAEEADDAGHKASVGEGFKKIWAWIKAHPYEASAVAAVIFLLIVWYYFSAPPASAAPAQASPSGSDAATMAAELQQEAINAQQTTALQQQQQAAAVAENNNSTLLQSQSIQAAATLSLANILASIQGLQITTQGSVDLANTAANQTVNLAGITASQEVNDAQIAAMLQESTLAALSNAVMNLVPAMQTGLQTSGAGFQVAANIPGLTTSVPITIASGVAGPTPATFQSQGFTQGQISNYFSNTNFGPL